MYGNFSARRRRANGGEKNDDVIDDVIKVNPNFTFLSMSTFQKMFKPLVNDTYDPNMHFEVIWVMFGPPSAVGTEEKNFAIFWPDSYPVGRFLLYLMQNVPSLTKKNSGVA